MIWLYLAGAVALGAAAGAWLRTRAYRRSDDEVFRTLPAWWAPVLVVLGTVLAAPFFAGQPPLVVVTYLLALAWAVLLALIDLDVRRLPDVLTLPGYLGFGGLLAACSLTTGDTPALLRAAACAGAAVLVFFLLALLSPGGDGLGFGDVKLAGVLGALLGWLGWLNAVLGLLGGFVLGGLVAGVLLLTRRADRRTHVSFGPAMVVAGYVWCLLQT